jgi:hypothetical protein
MKKYILVALLALGTAALLPSCSGGSDKETQTQTQTPQPQAEKKTVYACPMKCEGEKYYDKPGICPDCEMDLEQTEVTAESAK